MVKRILLVNFDRTSVPIFLKKNKFEVSHCNRVDKIISVLENEVFHMVIIDLALFNGSDFHVITDIKKNPLTSHVGVLVVGSIEKEENVKLIFESGVDDFIAAPISFSELQIRLIKILKMGFFDPGIIRITKPPKKT